MELNIVTFDKFFKEIIDIDECHILIIVKKN